MKSWEINKHYLVINIGSLADYLSDEALDRADLGAAWSSAG
jgi:hypothetical protein